MALFSFKSYVNFLSRNKLYTLIDLFGLGVSLMFVILIAVYTKQELSTDSFQKNGDDIYLLTNEQFLASSYRLGDKVKERYPQIRSVCGIVINKSDIPSISSTFQVPLNGQKISTNIGFVDSVFFQMFSFPLLEGQSARVLSDKMSCVISESYANRAFPGKNPIGERLPLFEGQIFTVSGVMKDISNSCIPYTDVLVRMDNADNYNPSIISEGLEGATNTILAFQVQPGFDIHRIEPDLKNLFKQIFWAYQTNIFKEVHFMPLKKVHFSSIDATDMLNQNSKKFVIILLSVGLLILIFAVLNYINLTVAQAGFRAKEMATRIVAEKNCF